MSKLHYLASGQHLRVSLACAAHQFSIEQARRASQLLLLVLSKLCPLTVVTDALPGLPRRSLALGGWSGCDCAVGTEDAAAYPAVVPPHQHAEGCLTLIASFALAVIHPVVFGGCCLVAGNSCHKLRKQLLHGRMLML